jgi:hypothetical protein
MQKKKTKTKKKKEKSYLNLIQSEAEKRKKKQIHKYCCRILGPFYYGILPTVLLTDN